MITLNLNLLSSILPWQTINFLIELLGASKYTGLLRDFAPINHINTQQQKNIFFLSSLLLPFHTYIRKKSEDKHNGDSSHRPSLCKKKGAMVDGRN